MSSLTRRCVAPLCAAQVPFGESVEVGDEVYVHMEAPDHTSFVRREGVDGNEWLEGRVTRSPQPQPQPSLSPSTSSWP